MFRNRRRVPRKRVLLFHPLGVCLVVPAIVTLAIHCGSSSEDDGVPGDDGNATDADDLDGGAADNLISGFDVPVWTYDVVFVDQGTNCLADSAPVAAPWQHRSCCEGVVCEGYCIRADDGGATCDCYGIHEGCWDGSICCTRRNGCAAPDRCEFSR